MFRFPKSRINENSGKTSIFFLEASLLRQIFVLRTSNFRGATISREFFDRNTLLFKSVKTRFLTNQRVYFLRERSFNMTRGSGNEDIETQSLKYLNIFIPSPLVILNELSLRASCFLNGRNCTQVKVKRCE